jgi:NAD(P)-dependent dehydrogenase (short-subunit alcohol dehydrogenase family)
MTLPSTPSFRLTGKRALVVGGSSGIGLACAVALAEAGAEVTVAARNLVKVQTVVDQMTNAGFKARAMALDVADVIATEQAVLADGPFDVLVNSAGLAIHSPAVETTLDDFDAVANINIKGAYFLTRAVAKGLLAAGKPGSLINITSQMALVGGIDRAVYCASKYAVEGFTKAMAIEWGKQGIRVNTLGPTFIRTPLTEPTFSNPDRVAWIMGKIKLGRVGEVTDMMGPVVYLASDASGLMTGAHLSLDGGWTAD